MKKIFKVFIIVAMMFMFTGCMKMNMKYEVKADGTLDVSMEMLMEESLLTMDGQNPEEAIKDMEEQMKSSADMKDAKVSPISKTIDGKKWSGISVVGTSSDSKKFLKEEKIDGTDSIVLTLPMSNATGGISGSQMDPSQLAAQGYSLAKIKEMGTEMNVVITMPSSPKSNVGEVKGNTVTIDLLELSVNNQKGDIIISSAKSSGVPMSLILGGVGVVALVVTIVMVLKNKKKKSDTVIEDSFTSENSEQPEEKEPTQEVDSKETTE